jgi:hypothetical protein
VTRSGAWRCHLPPVLPPGSKPHVYTHGFGRDTHLRWSGSRCRFG